MSKNITIEPSRYDEGVTVYEWGRYGRSSVLAGQTKKQFIDAFDTVEEAQAAYPMAEVSSHCVNPHNTFDHLEDEDGHTGPSPHDVDYGTDPQSQHERYNY